MRRGVDIAVSTGFLNSLLLPDYVSFFFFICGLFFVLFCLLFLVLFFCCFFVLSLFLFFVLSFSCLSFSLFSCFSFSFSCFSFFFSCYIEVGGGEVSGDLSPSTGLLICHSKCHRRCPGDGGAAREMPRCERWLQRSGLPACLASQWKLLKALGFKGLRLWESEF